MKKERKRFQECNFIIKVYRRLIYQIPYFFKAVYVWIISPVKMKRLLFSLTYVDWQVKANYLYTLEEVREGLKERESITWK